jgi:hypothetical protein
MYTVGAVNSHANATWLCEENVSYLTAYLRWQVACCDVRKRKCGTLRHSTVQFIADSLSVPYTVELKIKTEEI